MSDAMTRGETTMGANETRPGGAARTRTTNGPSGPFIWQRTDTVGTELVFPDADGRAASGTAVIGGTGPHSVHWRAAVDERSGVRELAVTCESSQSRRTLSMTRDDDGTLVFRTGDDEAIRLDGIEVVRLTDSPMFLSWALRRLGLTPAAGAVPAATARVLLPSLTVATGETIYHLVSDRRLRIGGDEAGATFDLDESGFVAYRPGRLRQA
jgi:hypothetical protein